MNSTPLSPSPAPESEPISTFTLSSTPSPIAPVGLSPIEKKSYESFLHANDSLDVSHDQVNSFYREQWDKWNNAWNEDSVAAGDEPTPEAAAPTLRYIGLANYVTSDLSPDAAKRAKEIFGNTSTPYTGDTYSNLIVGRALCSLAGYTGDPVTFIRERGMQALELSMPTQGYSTDNQLYALIGSKFATRERDKVTKQLQAAEARAKEMQKKRETLLPIALNALASQDYIQPDQYQVLKECGIAGDTERRIRKLTQRSATLQTSSAAPSPSGNIINSVRVLGLEYDNTTAISLFDTNDLMDAAQVIGSDKIARAYYLNLMRLAGRQHRDSHHSDSFLGNLGAATGNLITSTTRGVSESFIKGGNLIGFGVHDMLFGDDSNITKRYRALRADVETAFQQGYQERSDELAQNLGSSILWQISDFPTTIAPIVSTTASFASWGTVLAYGLGSFESNKSQAYANSVKEGDYSSNFIEHNLIPFTKAGTEVGINIITGKAADYAIKGIGKTSVGKAVAARITSKPLAAYAARVTEGVITETAEEAGEAIINEAVEATGLVKDRQKEQHWENFKKTFYDSEFWAGNVGMNLIFGAFGYKGSRSKSPYKDIFDKLNFTKEEKQALVKDLQNAREAGAKPTQISDIVKEHLTKKEAANPEEFKEKASAVMANAYQQQLIQEAAQNGVRDALIKQSGISDMAKDADGNIKVKRLSRAEDGKFEMVEETYTEEQLNSWLASNVESTLTQEIIDTQKAVRGEKVSRAVESAKNTPFSRVISMLNAPAELINKMKNKSSFDEEAMQWFAEYALEEINSRISSGQSAEEARNAEFGTTGASLGSVANLASDFAKRVSQARKQGDLKEDEIAQSNAFILPGRTPGDNILMIARGEASAKDVAHDWLEVFGRSRFHANPSYWRAALDALDADLLNNGIISKSLFDNVQGHRDDLEYIEVFSHLAEANWLSSHDIYAVSENTHNILDEVIDDLGAVQGGLEAAKLLRNYLESEQAKNALGSAIDPLRDILTKAGATLTDILSTAQESAPKDAADFVLRQREYIQESTSQDLKSLGEEADSPAPLNTTTVDPQQEALPPDATDGTTVTVADLAQMNGIDPQTGSVPAPPNATYSRVDPKKSGKNLIGGIAHGQPDGSIVGAAKLSDISIHPSIGIIDPALVRDNPNEKEVIVFRKKDGTLQAIGGLSFLNNSTSCGVENVPVRVYSSGKKYTPQWAAKFAMESKIRANLATTADILSHITKNSLTRDQALRQNLIPKDSNGQELSPSRAAWILSQHANKKTISDTISGKLNTEQALATIADKYSKLLTKARQFTPPGSQPSSFSISPAKKSTNVFQDMVNEKARAMSRNFVELNAVTAKDPYARAYITNVMKSVGTSDAEIDALFAIMDGIVKSVQKMEGDFPVMAEWNKRQPDRHEISTRHKNAKLPKFIEQGKALVPKSSAFKKNGDYIFNIDLGTLCAKREPLDWLLQIMAQEKLLSNLGTIQIERLKDLLKSEGLATACDVCFVEAKRYRMLQDSVKTSFYWNAVCHAVGITDDNEVGSPRELSDEQVKILQEMADNDNFKEAFKKYIDENTQRVEDYDLGLTPNMMNKLAKLFLQDHSLMGDLNPHRLMTTAGVDELMRTYAGHTDLPSFLAGVYGSSTAKPLEGFNVYDAMSWLKSFDDKTLAKNMTEIYALGGGRAQSFTDFSPVLFIDYVQMFLDFQARNLPLHVYTKVPAFVKLFGRTGTMINMSFVPEMVEGVDADHAGLKKDENGKWVYAWSKDSFPIEEAYKLRKRKDFGGRVGIIAVGVSDAHIWMLLNDPRIDMIIPYHASGMPVLVKNKTGLRYATDYTDVQTTRPMEGGKREATWSYNEALQRLKDPRKAAAEYLQYCKENNFIPKFEQFSNHKNYYKLLEDFRGYDNNGNAVLQGAVRLQLPRNWRKELRAALSDRQELQGKLEELKGKEAFLKKARRILRYQPLDGKVREVMMARLKSALPGKNSVQSLKRNDFLDKLEEALTEEGSAESAKARVEVYRKGDGIVYGFAYGDTIYLNEDVTNANAPAHEFTHIWAKVAQHANSTLWEEGVNLLKKTKEWNKVLTDNLYESIRNDDNAVASEVLARLVGKENEAFVRMLVDPDGKPLEKPGIIAKVFEWMREMWNNIRSIFDAPGGKPLTLKEFSRMPLKDLWDETRNKQFNEYARVALNKDISQIRSEIQVEHDEARAAYNPEEDTEPASFSITAATPRRKYMPLAEAVKMEEYVAMAEYARKLKRDSRNIALSNNKNRLDDAAEAAINLRSLLNAVFVTLPKEAQPWKALKYAKKNIDALTWAVANPAANLNSTIAPNLTEEEISQYNSLNWKKRREWLTRKLNRLTDSVAESAARSIEAHACRVLLQAAEAAAKSLDPKEQPSGKERRGVTSSTVFEQARDFFKMFTWDVGQRADALTAASDNLNDPNISEEDYEKAVRDRNAILTFAGLYKESLPRVKAGVEAFLKFLQTGKDQWNDKLREERRAIEAIQLAIAKLQPETNHTKTTAKEIKKRGTIGRLLVSSLNPVQDLKILANLPGEVGKIFAEIRKNLALAQDSKTHAIDQAHNDAEHALDTILGVAGKSKPARDMARADFLTKANELKKTGIVRKGRIKVTTFEFTREEIENLVNVRKTLGEEAFISAIDKHRKKASKEDLLNETIPYNEVLNDALSQIRSPEYRGGKVYVEHYGKRDTHHVEELELTRLQAANLWLLAQQPSYSNKYDQDGKLIERGMLDILGYTDDVIDQLEAYCGKQLIEYALWKREYLNTTGLFEAYEEYMGLPFPKEENYWPGAFDTPAANGSFDAFTTTFEGSGVYGMLIKRKKHVNEPNTAVDMEAAWEHAISQHFHYIHLSPLTRQIRAITRDTDTRNRVRQMVGGTILDNLSVGVNALDGAPAMQLQASMQANSFFSRFFGNLAKALLNMATSVGIKQVSAFGHALAHPLINWVNIAPKLITSLLSEIKGVKIGAITPSEIRKLKSFQIRTNRTNLTKRASQLKPGETQSKLALIEILGGKMLEYSDYWANSVAMAAVYNTEYARAKKLMLETSGTRTLTPEQEAELRQHCENTISETLKQTAQPLEREDKPAFLQQQNWAQTANAFMLGEVLSKIACATSIYKAERAKAYGQSGIEKRKSLFRAIFKTYKYIGGMSLASQGILALLCYSVGSAPDTDDEEFDEWFISQLLAGILCFGYATPIPVLGDSIAAGGQAIFGQYGAFATYGSAAMSISYNDLQNLKKAFNTDKGAAERIYSGSNSLRLATALLNFALGGTKHGNIVADLFNVANNASNAVRPGLQYAKNAEKKEAKQEKAALKNLKKLQSSQKPATKNRHTEKVTLLL